MGLGQALLVPGIGGAAFSPDNLEGLVYWLDPADLSVVADETQLSGTWSPRVGTPDGTFQTGATGPKYRDSTAFSHGKPMVELVDGEDNTVDIAAHASLNVEQMTYVTVWFRYKQSTGWLFNKKNTQAANVASRSQTSAPTFGVRTPSTFNEVDAAGPASLGHPLFYAGSYDEVNVQVRVGTHVDQLAETGTLDTANNDILTFGGHPSSNSPTKGFLGHLLIYNRALTDAELDQLYDWMLTEYPASSWHSAGITKVTGFGSEASGPTVFDDTSNSRYVLFTEESGTLHWATAPHADPHNWTDQGTTGIANVAGRGSCCEHSGTYYLFYDRSDGIQMATNTDGNFDSWTESASNPVIPGSGTPGASNEFYRWPSVINESGNLTIMLDGRANSFSSGSGSIWRATSTIARITADATDWTVDGAALLDPEDLSGRTDSYDQADLSHPFLWKAGANDYRLLCAPYNTANLHCIAYLTSTATASGWTVQNNGWPIMPTHQNEDDEQEVYGASMLVDQSGGTWLYYNTDKLDNTTSIYRTSAAV